MAIPDTLESLCRKLAIYMHRSPTLRLRAEETELLMQVDRRVCQELLDLAVKQCILRKNADGWYEARGN